MIYRICLSKFNTALSVSIKFYSWLIKMEWDIFAYWQDRFLSDTHSNDASNMNAYVDSVKLGARGFYYMKNDLHKIIFLHTLRLIHRSTRSQEVG